MRLDDECRDAIDLFWARAGEVEDFPRSLERSICLSLPVAIVKLPRLALRDIENWLRLRGVQFSFNCMSRSVRGCLIAFRGKGVIFVDGADSVSETRYTLAHETGHFLIDYWLQREKSLKRYGQTILEVLDGLRQPTINERLFSMLDHHSIGTYTDILERDPAGGANSEIWKIEDRADLIALELLTPSQTVLSNEDLFLQHYEEREALLVNSLVEHYGLPERIAEVYAANLLKQIGRGPSLAEALRFSR